MGKKVYRRLSPQFSHFNQTNRESLSHLVYPSDDVLLPHNFLTNTHPRALPEPFFSFLSLSLSE